MALLVKLPMFYFFRLYSRYWRYASVDDVITIVLATACATILITAITWGMQMLGFFGMNALPRSVPIIDGMLTILFVGGTRFFLRAVEYLRVRISNGGLGNAY